LQILNFHHRRGDFNTCAPDVNTDERADIYSFGVMFYELIAGITLWHLSAGQDGLMSKLYQDAPDLRTYRKHVPEALAQRLIQTLSGNPEVRPPAAAAVLAGFEDETAKLASA
jgi:serine/threonine protein kinase